MARIKNTGTDRAGNSFRNAYNLGRFNDTSVVVDEFVGNSDRSDFYKMTIARRSSGIISLTGLKSNADVEIFNQKKERIGSLTNGGTRREFTSGTTPAGVYYLRVFPRGTGETTYRLTVLTVTP